MSLYAVSCKEIEDVNGNEIEDGLHWTLLTTELVETPEQARKIARYYEANVL